MGKDLQHQESGISLDNPQPGCMWGILHHFHRTKWLNVKKRLPSRRFGSSKNDSDQGSKETAPGGGEIQGNIDAKTENSAAGKAGDSSGSVSKSMRSRLKALIVDEVYKRRGQHNRTSSCPSPTHSPLARTNSIHRRAPSSVDLPDNDISLADKTSKHNRTSSAHCSATSLSDPVLPSMAKPESKRFPGALDQLDMKKEVFLKFLHYRGSAFGHQLHSTQGSKKPVGLTKSVSFPSAGSFLREAFIVKEIEHYAKAERPAPSPELCREGSVTKRLLTNPEFFDNVPPDLSGEHKNKHDSKQGKKSFRNLRDKIRHAIRESKKEKHRIVMDAVLDKVPHGHDKKEELDTKYRRSLRRSSSSTSPFGKTDARYMKRTVSCNDFADRYNRLLESCFKQKVKHHTSERQSYGALGTPSSSSAGPKTLGRILSLPDLRCYGSNEDCLYASSSNTPFSTAAGHTLSISGDQKHLEIQSDYDDFSGLQTHESPAPYSNNIKRTSSSDSVLDKPTQISAPEIDLQFTTEPAEFSMDEGDSFADQENISKTENISTAEDSVNDEKGWEDMCMRIEVDDSNRAAFDYVKRILQESGLCRGEFLERWHSAEMPLNPLVFDEVEQCIMAQSDCTGSEDDGAYDHLLLFSSVNETVLEIYDKSYVYWPNPLTCRSCIRRMPVGYGVLEEVWGNIRRLLRQSDLLEDPVGWDLARGDNWMNLQFEAECVGLELEDLILDDLLDELLYDDLLVY
ncbi:PREDICTED: protein TRM32-like [Ipomoea nil]|uniref:protein TRM32-like n=1 Tax=Ipomoea nil TaxID=35883 RepID=UPI000901A68B|nr:PREDICTED: protein TRM32-like [Ipomoea nil]